VNRADAVKTLVLLGLVADRVKRQIADMRAGLEIQARTEYVEQGMAPTWNLRGVATVGLAIADTTVVVDDEAKLVAWLAEHRPTEVETVTRPREAGLKALLDAVVVDGDTVHIDGDVVPGLAVVHGGRPKHLTVRPTNEARQHLGAEADAMLDALMMALTEPVGTDTP
jgi:hypothetical protein